MSDSPPILVLESPIEREELARLVRATFGDFVKFVADIRLQRIGIGGGMHADAEARLLETGSAQVDLWGGNYWPGRGLDGCLEYTSLINIRPADDNRGMEIGSPAIRDAVRGLVLALVGRGEAIG